MDLVSLPREILANISSCILSRQDIKSVRLTCRELAGIVTPILFYSICISPLIQDRDTFLSIANSPLAHHVRVIVWEELNGNLRELEQQSWHERVSGYEIPFFQQFTTNVRAVFWLDSAHPCFRLPDLQDWIEEDDELNKINQEKAIASSFLDEFQLLMTTSLLNVHTLASRPMHPQRQIKLPSMDNLASTESIKSIIHRNESSCTFNFGFTYFLIPTLKTIAASELRTKITRLIYADESTTKETMLLSLKDSDAAAFSNIQDLDLCITGQNVEPSKLRGFSTCLGSAKNLRTLKVCQEGVWESTTVPYALNILGLIPTLDRLTEVHFVDTNINGKLPTSVPFRFIGRHARTLKRVYFTSCGIKRKELEQLAAMDSLNLERFVVISGDDIDDGRHEHVGEEDILSYINQTIDINHQRSPPYPPGDGEAELHTHDAAFDIDACTTQAICETSRNWWERIGYNPIDRPAFDDDDFEYSLVRFPGLSGNDTNESSESKAPDDLDMHPFYKKEEDEHRLRVEGAPRWDWGRDKEGRVWYWQVSGPGGHATEIWRFEHNGEEAYGNDPLEFWADWYDEAEDKAEATPYGWRLHEFVESEGVGSEIPQQGACEYLEQYDAFQSPFFDFILPVSPAGLELSFVDEWMDLF
ncbi:hypothetical protein F53441_14307 [Fusarium austroafricanum]|uniref:F-box domain-containing protein n=1 Tax=Fusarium austroafricanum TaxID=2364996 RepID=A0A8H4NGM8_9HYPO|nr:hypothetical protein F53441_14307 [Fusarium austroafricanum]